MKRKIALFLAVYLVISLFSGCCLKHEWESATCEVPKTCAKCGKTEGEALDHEWQEATCEDPETCLVCGLTQGKALDHSWIAADCENAQRCRVCGHTQGEAKGHEWQEATCMAPKTCDRCGGTEGDIGTHKIEDPYLYAREDDLIYLNGVCVFCEEELDHVPDWKTAVYQLIPGDYRGFANDLRLSFYENGTAVFWNGSEEVSMTWASASDVFTEEMGMPFLRNSSVQVMYWLNEPETFVIITYDQDMRSMQLWLMDSSGMLMFLKNR